MSGSPFIQLGLALLVPLLAFGAQLRAEAIGSKLSDSSQANRTITATGVVCFYHRPANELYLQGEAGAFLVRPGAVASFELGSGQLLAVEGELDTGPLARSITAKSIKLLGEGPLPAPVQVKSEQLAGGGLDFHYCQTEGIVRTVAPRNDGLLALRLAQGAGYTLLLIRDYHLNDCRKLIDAGIRAAGVCVREPGTNNSRESVATLRVTGIGDLTVLEGPPAHTPLADRSAITRLAQTKPGDLHRVRFNGIVTLQESGVLLTLANGSSGLCVYTAQSGLLRRGDQVEILGFPAIRNSEPVLEDAVFTQLGTGPAPPPTTIIAQDLFGPNFQSCLIQFEGVTAQKIQRGARTVLLNCADGTFTARLAKDLPNDSFAPLREGTRVSVRGINCTRQFGSVLLADSTDLEVVHRPAVTLKRILYAGLPALIAVSAALWLRRRTQRRKGL